MTRLRILHGLERLTGTLATGDDRLPAICRFGSARAELRTAADHSLRCRRTDHMARVVAVQNLLFVSYKNYNGAPRRGVTHHPDTVAAHVR